MPDPAGVVFADVGGAFLLWPAPGNFPRRSPKWTPVQVRQATAHSASPRPDVSSAISLDQSVVDLFAGSQSNRAPAQTVRHFPKFPVAGSAQLPAPRLNPSGSLGVMRISSVRPLLLDRSSAEPARGRVVNPRNHEGEHQEYDANPNSDEKRIRGHFISSKKIAKEVFSGRWQPV